MEKWFWIIKTTFNYLINHSLNFKEYNSNANRIIECYIYWVIELTYSSCGCWSREYDNEFIILFNFFWIQLSFRFFNQSVCWSWQLLAMRCLQKLRGIHNEYYFYSILDIALMLREDINCSWLRQASCILCIAIYINIFTRIIYKLCWRLSREIAIKFWKK